MTGEPQNQSDLTTPELDEWVQRLIGSDLDSAPYHAAIPGDPTQTDLENMLAGFDNAAPKTTSPQPQPLYDKKTPPQKTPPEQKKPPTQTQPPAKPQPIVYDRTDQIDKSGQDKRKDKLPLIGATTSQAVTNLVEGRG